MIHEIWFTSDADLRLEFSFLKWNLTNQHQRSELSSQVEPFSVGGNEAAITSSLESIVRVQAHVWSETGSNPNKQLLLCLCHNKSFTLYFIADSFVEGEFGDPVWWEGNRSRQNTSGPGIKPTSYVLWGTSSKHSAFFLAAHKQWLGAELV